MDMKMNCVHMMLEKLETYNPSEGAAFTTYIYHDIFDAIKECQLQRECWTFEELTIPLRHRQSRMTQEPLKGESIATAVL